MRFPFRKGKFKNLRKKMREKSRCPGNCGKSGEILQKKLKINLKKYISGCRLNESEYGLKAPGNGA